MGVAAALELASDMKNFGMERRIRVKDWLMMYDSTNNKNNVSIHVLCPRG